MFGQPPQQQGYGFGKVSGYDTPGAISQWLWGNGYSQIGPMLNNAPPIVRQIMQQPGMKMDPTQYRSVGGYTPQFAQALNAALFPGMNFRTGEQSMGQLIGQPMQRPQQQQGYDNQYGDFMNKMMDYYHVRPGERNQNSLMDMLKLYQSGAYQPY